MRRRAKRSRVFVLPFQRWPHVRFYPACVCRRLKGGEKRRITHTRTLQSEGSDPRSLHALRAPESYLHSPFQRLLRMLSRFSPRSRLFREIAALKLRPRIVRFKQRFTAMYKTNCQRGAKNWQFEKVLICCCFLQPEAKKEEEPIHIINIALQIEKNCKDMESCRKMVYEFTHSKVKISSLLQLQLSATLLRCKTGVLTVTCLALFFHLCF